MKGDALETLLKPLIQSLPAPHAIYTARGISFSVYRVKKYNAPGWEHASLKKLLELMRRSYERYGARDRFDAYDRRAAIYIVKTRYQRGGEWVTEWLSSRLLSGYGSPMGTKELEIFTYNGTGLDTLLRIHDGIASKSAFWKTILSSSRMCGIRDTVRSSRSQGTQHRYTSLANALIRAQFLIDHPEAITEFRYVVAILPAWLHHKRLRFKNERKNIVPRYTPAHRFFNVPKQAIALKRDIYSYEYPRYWLNMKDLQKLFVTLYADGALTRETLIRYCDAPTPAEIDERWLGKLLTIQGNIAGSSITGEELRAQVDISVRDMPELRITPVRKWFRPWIAMLDAADVNIIKNHPELSAWYNHHNRNGIERNNHRHSH